jgi:hypothetical protein
MTKPRAIQYRNHLLVSIYMRAGHLAGKSLTSNSSLTLLLRAEGYGGVHPAVIGSGFEHFHTGITKTLVVE